MRRTETVEITEGRDAGKKYQITEMSAEAAEWWAFRALQAVASSNVDLNLQAPMRELAVQGIKALAGVAPDMARPLLDEMMSCVQILVPATQKPRALLDGDIEDVKTRFMLRKAVMAALRAIVLHSVGAFASSGRDQTRVATSALDVPPQFQARMQRQGKLFVYHVPSERNSRTESFYHPELAAQVWGRARARVLDGPSALGLHTAGALAVDPSTLLGIQGDAIYTSTLPTWSLPVASGGGDDGKPGRLRLQGYLSGSFLTPERLQQRLSLRGRAEKAGVESALEHEVVMS